MSVGAITIAIASGSIIWKERERGGKDLEVDGYQNCHIDKKDIDL